MPTRDNHSSQIVLRGLVATAIATNTTTNGDIIDTADFDMGIKFAFDVSAFTDGVYAISYEEGDAANLSDAVAVSSDKIIGAAVSLSAATAATGIHTGNGLHSTLRFVRAVVTSTGTTSGATVGAVVVEAGEYNPQ